MCTKKDYGLHCHLLGAHSIHKHLIHGRVARPVWRLSKFCPMREVVTRAFRKINKSWRKTIPDNHLVPTFYKLSLGRCPHQYSLPVAETWTHHRHYLLYRHAQECLHNLQPKSGCVLPMHSLLQAKFFVASCADVFLHFQKTVPMRTTRRW